MKFWSQNTYRAKTVKQFIQFGLVGASNSVIYLGIYYLFTWVSDTTYMAMLGHIMAWIISVGNSYVLNSKFTFSQSKVIWWKALLKVYAGYSFCFISSTLLTYLQMEVLSVPSGFVPIINLLLSGPVNFLIIKHWSFRNSKNKGHYSKSQNSLPLIYQIQH